VFKMFFIYFPLANPPAPLRRRTRHGPGGAADRGRRRFGDDTADSFTLKTTKKRQFLKFSGFVGIVSVDLKIDVLAGDYTFKGTLSNVNLDGVTNPVTVSLTVGDDTGSFDVTAGIN